MRAIRTTWRRDPVEAQSVELGTVQVLAPAWFDAQHRERNSGSFKVRLVPISLPAIPGTGQIMRDRPWRMRALAAGQVSI